MKKTLSVSIEYLVLDEKDFQKLNEIKSWLCDGIYSDSKLVRYFQIMEDDIDGKDN